MADHLLSPYWAVKHRRPRDYEFFQKLQPPVVKIMDGGDNDYKWVRDNLPNSLLFARDWGLDDNEHSQQRAMLVDPVGTGKRHANEWKAKQAKLKFDPANTVCMGVNEPWVWEPNNTNKAVKQTTEYTIAFCDEMARLGLRAAAMSLSVGWPRNDGPDMPPRWDEFPGVEAAIKRGNHVLSLHEYWKDSGPADGWGWYGGRALKCPWDVPIVIGECGFSYAVGRYNIPTREQGWFGRITREQYADQIVEYHNGMAKDSRILGLCLYLCDFAAGEWQSKDIEPAYDQIINRKSKLAKPATGQNPAPPPAPKPPTPPPPAPTPTPVPESKTFRFPLDTLRVTQWWGRTHYGIDYGTVTGTPVKACADGKVVWVDDDRKTKAKNGGYGLYVRVHHPQLNIYTFYAHLSRQDVKVGDTVKMGQVIGLSGNTGNSTGPHLHFEVRLANDDGSYNRAGAGNTYNGVIDPMAFVAGMKAVE